MWSGFPRTFKTFTFRLALVYVGLFSFSVICLFGFIYAVSMGYLREQVADSIRGQYYYLLNQYREYGSEGVEVSVQELIADDAEGAEIYLLMNREDKKLAGNLNEWPAGAEELGRFETDGKWIRFHIEDMRGNPEGIEINAIAIPLSQWRSLLVGQSTRSIENVGQSIIRTFWASLFLTFIMAFIGAVILTKSVIGRINVINQSADRIMRGNIAERFRVNPHGDEFDDLSSNLNRMLDTIENLLESLSLIANNIAHDLRSPLSRIISRLDGGLRDIDAKNPAYPLLKRNISDMENLVDTFNSILNISELEANTEFRPYELCDLQEILGALVEFYEPYAADKKIALRYEISEPVLIYGEKQLLNQAFANLIDNALKFTPEKGRVVISAERADDGVAILIADSGPGIPEEFRSKVFDKFFRMEQSRNTKGNGLGLSLVAAIARIHDAKIMLEDNNPGLIVRVDFLRKAQ